VINAEILIKINNKVAQFTYNIAADLTFRTSFSNQTHLEDFDSMKVGFGFDCTKE